MHCCASLKTWFFQPKMSDNDNELLVQQLTEFKSELINFFDQLIELFPNEGDLIMARFFIKDINESEQIIMKYFIKELIPLKDQVKIKDENFFLKNNIMFATMEKDKVNYFKKIWRSGVLTPEDKDAIWGWFAHFIKMAEKYNKIQIKLVK